MTDEVIDRLIPVWAVLDVLDDLVERGKLTKRGRIDAIWNLADVGAGTDRDEFRRANELILDNPMKDWLG